MYLLKRYRPIDSFCTFFSECKTLLAELHCAIKWTFVGWKRALEQHVVVGYSYSYNIMRFVSSFCFHIFIITPRDSRVDEPAHTAKQNKRHFSGVEIEHDDDKIYKLDYIKIHTI